MKPISRINDKFFKDVFKKDANASIILRKTLPDEINSRVDFSTLKQDNTNYVSGKLDEFFSDIVFNAEMTTKS
ncbi:MAG: Rpn family recombination-promoting nuclease/putative transposase, partial [bacterium]|nr:Rpn family recombination-promoting nuclease/putative transposase [bacterium]